MNLELKQLSKDSIIYGVGGIVAKGISFFLLPIYTRVFPPAEYGIIVTVTIINSLLSVFLAMGTDAAQSYYFFKHKKKSAQIKIVTAILQWRLIWGSVLVILMIFLSPFFNRFFFEGKLSLECFVIAFVGMLFMQILTQSAEVFRLLYKSSKYIYIMGGYAVLSSVFSLFFVLGLGWGIKGYFAGLCLGSLVMALVGCLAIRDYLDFSKLHREWWPAIIKFSFPLIFSGLAMYCLHSADRWFIIRYCGQAAVGIYGVGAKFVILISFAVDAFRQAWSPMAMDALHRPEGKELYRTVARLYLGVSVFCVFLLTVFSPILVKIFTAPAYYSSYPIVGILSWQAIFYGFFLFLTAGIWKRKKTLWISIAMGIALFVNIVLDIFLVPRLGGVGAAIATSIAFFVWNCITFIISEKYWSVNYPLKIFGIQIGFGVIGCWSVLSLYKNNFSVVSVGLIVAVVTAVLIGTSLGQDKLFKIINNLKPRLAKEDI